MKRCLAWLILVAATQVVAAFIGAGRHPPKVAPWIAYGQHNSTAWVDVCG
jgi:hypothetical protein